MQRQFAHKNYIEDFATFAMRFINSKNMDEWQSVQSELADYAGANDDYHIRQLLTILATFQAKKMGESIDLELFTSQLSELSNLQTDNIIHHYARITAEIMECADQPLEAEIHQIVWDLYQLKAAVNEGKYKGISEMEAKVFEDWCQGLPNIINGFSIHDCVAESEIGEYAHYLLELFIDSLLNKRDVNYKKELGFFNDGQKDEFSLTIDALIQLQETRNNISEIDAILWRLNLHAHPTIRTQLERHIKLNHVNASEYIKHDYVNSNLKITYISQVIVDIDHALPMIFNHLEHMQSLVNSYVSMIHSIDHIRDFDHYYNKINQGLNAIIFDCIIFSGQLDAVPFDKSNEKVMRLLKLARMTASALMYLLNGDCEENFVNNDLSKNLHLDDLSNYKLTNAFSALVQARLRISFEGNSYDKAAKDVRLIANVEYLESALQGDVTNIFSNIFIKDYYFFLITFCKNSQELELIQRNGLMDRIQALKIPKLSQNIFDLVYYVNDKVTRMISDQGYESGSELVSLDERILINLLNKCHSDVFDHIFGNNTVATYTSNMFLDYAYSLGEHFKDHQREMLRCTYKILKSNLKLLASNYRVTLANNISKTSPVFLRFRNAILIRNKHDEPSIKYPDKDNVLSTFTRILQQIKMAKSEQDFEIIRNILEEANTRLEKLAVEFNDVIDQSNSIELLNQYDLFQSERVMVNFLAVMLSRRDQRFITEMSLSDFSIRNHTTTASCSMAIIFYYYVMVIASIQKFDILDIKELEKGNINDYLDEAKSNLLDIFKFKLLSKCKIRYQFYDYYSHEAYQELVSGIHIMLAPDKSPENLAEKCMMEYTDILIEKILSIRHHVENWARQSRESKKHQEFLRLCYSLEEHDTLLMKLNLFNHKELRGRYKRHIQSCGLTEEMIQHKLPADANRVFMFSGLLNLDDKRKDNNLRFQFDLAGDMFLNHITRISMMYSMIGIITKDKYDQYEELLANLEWQMRTIHHDVKFLIAFFISTMIDDLELDFTLSKLMLGYSVSRHHVQDIPDQFHNYYSKYSNLYKIRIDKMTKITSHVLSECVSHTLLAYFDQRIKQANGTDRLAEFRRMANYIRKNAEMATSHNKITKQYISDIFLCAYLACETQEDVNALLADDLKSLVFSLELSRYGKYSRDLVFADIEEKRRVKLTNTSYDPEVIKKNSILIQLYFKNLAIAHEEHGNAPQDQRSDKTVIVMTCKILQYFLKITRELMTVINKNELTLQYEKLMTGIADQINLYQRKFVPSEFTYRPITINASTHVSESFRQNEIVKQQKPAKKKSRAQKTINTTTTNASDDRLQTDFVKVAARYKKNVNEIHLHYSNLLNSKERSVKENQNIQIKSVMGLMYLLPMIQDDDYRQQVMEEMELHFGQLTKQVDPDTYNELFFGKYTDYLAVIQRYKRVHQSIALVKVQKQDPLPTVVTKPRSRYQPCLYAPIKSYTIDQPIRMPNKIPKWICLPKRELPAELAEFSMMWRDISLDIELNPNELTLISFLYKQHLIPLIQAGAVGDTIRGVPYRDVDTVCFAKVDDLEKLLHDNQELLGFKSCLLMHDTFFRLTYTVDCHDEEVLDVAFIEDTLNKASALNKMATNYVMGVTLYYDYFNQVLLDPRHLFTLTKNNIIDLNNRFDSNFNVDQFFIDHPDRFIKVLATVSKSLKYDVVVQADYVKEVAMRNKHLFYRSDIKSRYPQSLLDKLICHGYTEQAFTIFHKQCDIFLNLLYPLFSKTSGDIEIIRRTCNKADLRYQAYEREYIKSRQYNPKKRMLMLSKEHENHMRIGFWRDLLQDKYLMYYEETVMRNNVNLLDRINFSSVLRNYLFKLSFVINKSVIKALDEDFWSILKINVEHSTNIDCSIISNRFV